MYFTYRYEVKLPRPVCLRERRYYPIEWLHVCIIGLLIIMSNKSLFLQFWLFKWWQEKSNLYLYIQGND